MHVIDFTGGADESLSWIISKRSSVEKLVSLLCWLGLVIVGSRDCWRSFFDKALQPLPRKPVIVIDESNDLMDWKEPDPLQPELKRLLAFLIGISKQKRQAHVILATSVYFLANWLTQVGMTRDKFRVEVLGDLTEEEAEKFIVWQKQGI
ncbi:hypothetical protein Ndes2437B_g04167 [Nannochloris sp. 'desiccata']